MSSGLPESELIHKAQNGDREAFYAIYNTYKRPILNFVYRLLGDKQAAEDITQETFIKVYLNLSTFVPRGKLSSWIYAIASNLAKNEMRRDKRFSRVSLEEVVSDGEDPITLNDILFDEKSGPDALLDNENLKQLIHHVIHAIPFKYRQVLVLCDMQNLSYEETARILGCSVGTIASRLSRARAEFIRRFKIAQGGTKDPEARP